MTGCLSFGTAAWLSSVVLPCGRARGLCRQTSFLGSLTRTLLWPVSVLLRTEYPGKQRPLPSPCQLCPTSFMSAALTTRPRNGALFGSEVTADVIS